MIYKNICIQMSIFTKSLKSKINIKFKLNDIIINLQNYHRSGHPNLTINRVVGGFFKICSISM